MIWSRPWGSRGCPVRRCAAWPAELDAKVAEFRDRPLDAGPYRYLWIDALTQRVREGGRVVNVSAVIATAANAEGRREIVGFDIVTTEDTAAWTEFLRGPGGPGPGRGGAGHLRRPRRDQSGHRHGVGRGRLAAVPDPLHGQPGLAGARRATGR